MKYLKTLITILWISLFYVSFVDASLEDMTIRAKYIGVVNIVKVEKMTVTSIRTGLNRKSEDNVSRYILEIKNTIKGNSLGSKELILDVWEKDYYGKNIKLLPIGKQVLVFLINFKPFSDAWVLKKNLGHFTPIVNFNNKPYNYNFGIIFLDDGVSIKILDKTYLLSQIKQISNICNSSEFEDLQKRANLLYKKNQDDSALQLFHDAYQMCPTKEVKFNISDVNRKLRKQKFSWQIKQIGLPIFLFESLLFLLFLLIGYYGKWRWTGILFLVYAVLILVLLPSKVSLIVAFFLFLPFVSYSFGTLLYRIKYGVWLQDKVKEEMAKSFIEGKDEEDSYVVWEHERPVFSTLTIITMTLLFVAGTLLLFNIDSSKLPASFILIPFVFLIPALLFVLITMNRLRYRYGCHSKGYGYVMNDNRMKLISLFSFATGVADNNQTLAGAGLISSSVGGIQREWSSAQWCRYDDNKRIIIINHGCCKSDKLYASKKSYKKLKNIVMQSIDKRCIDAN